MATTHQFNTTLSWPVDTANTHPAPDYQRDNLLGGAGKQNVAGSALTVFGGNQTGYNPEELLLMSLSQCHMLTFLAIASKKACRVIAYRDDAIGELGLGEFGAKGKMSMQRVRLRPVVRVSGATIEDVASMHEKAHANCFMANSVNFPVEIEPQTEVA
jgi:organic hydroperoxide reductase OsmC/OhrA